MLENKSNKFSETGSEDELLTLEATPSLPESENIPDFRRGGFNNTCYCVGDKKWPSWMNITIVLLVFSILILHGLTEAVHGTCPKYPRKTAAFCQIGQSILGKLSLNDNHRSVKSVDSTSDSFSGKLAEWP